MSVPDFQPMMLPFLRFSQDQKEHSLQEVKMLLIDYYQLSNDDVEELVPSGRQTRLNNRVSWISTFFKKAKLIEQTKRGFYKITPRGNQLLMQNPKRIDMKVLQQYPEFVEFRTSKNGKNKKAQIEIIAEQTEITAEQSKTPEESLEIAYQIIRTALAAEILEKVKSCSPAFFERLVVELLVKMGYGGTLQDAGKAVGKSGDGGIDGIIKEDRLGLDVIYLQAKRWEGNVSRPEIQKFAGALLGNQARKGVFITTSDFTKEAKDYAKSITSNIILINGEELAELMIDYNAGVSVATTYEIKKIDSDYFSEE
jgi:restriction system protein